MAKARRRSNASMFSMVDMYMCFAMVMVALLEAPRNAVDQQIAERKEQLARIEKKVEEKRTERKAVETENEARIAQLEGEIESAREQLAKRQQAFQDWDIVVRRFMEYSKLTREPDYHFYLRASGIYSSANPTQKWTKRGLARWLSDVAAQQAPGETALVVLYTENGANDRYSEAMDIVNDTNKKGEEKTIDTYFILLPSGVTAGPSDHLHTDKKGGGK